MIGWLTKDNYKSFKKLYDKAVEDNKEVFIFESNTMDTVFCKYVLEYLDGRYD